LSKINIAKVTKMYAYKEITNMPEIVTIKPGCLDRVFKGEVYRASLMSFIAGLWMRLNARILDR